jgi:shikimate dehydrogenase
LTSLAGVLGWPVAHSRSPAMHNAAFRELGLDWRYGKLPVPPALFEETARALPGSGYRGANVTIPHKEAALDIAEDASDAAREIGAANTLTFADRAVRADNTDAGGLLDALGEPPARMRALVLGAGGSAAAAVWALGQAGASEVAIWNRTPERARELAERLGASFAERPGPCDLLVNATSVGLRPQDSLDELPLAGLEPPPLVVDLVYGEHAPPVSAWAETGGARVVDGLEVLVHQGARSFEIWTGREAPVEIMLDAARNP